MYVTEKFDQISKILTKVNNNVIKCFLVLKAARIPYFVKGFKYVNKILLQNLFSPVLLEISLIILWSRWIMMFSSWKQDWCLGISVRNSLFSWIFLDNSHLRNSFLNMDRRPIIIVECRFLKRFGFRIIIIKWYFHIMGK